MIELQQFRQYF